MPKRKEKQDTREQVKEPHATPRRTVHGNLEKITLGIRTTGSDGFDRSVIMKP